MIARALVEAKVGTCGCPEEVWHVGDKFAVLHFETDIGCVSIDLGAHRHGVRVSVSGAASLDDAREALLTWAEAA